ncbi:MAG: hypothetical protein WCP19_05805, partial [Chloroflexota bacterium]
ECAAYPGITVRHGADFAALCHEYFFIPQLTSIKILTPTKNHLFFLIQISYSITFETERERINI